MSMWQAVGQYEYEYRWTVDLKTGQFTGRGYYTGRFRRARS